MYAAWTRSLWQHPSHEARTERWLKIALSSSDGEPISSFWRCTSAQRARAVLKDAMPLQSDGGIKEAGLPRHAKVP
eukprot:1257242-Prymnesium_polylepis.1